MKLISRFAIVLLMTPTLHAAQTQKAGRPIRVSVKVSADDVMQASVTSRINAGLRALGDVVLVDDDAVLRASIVGTTINGSRELGYTFSVVVTKAMQREEEEGWFKAAASSAGGVSFLKELFGDRVIVVHHSLLVDSNLV